MGRRTNTILQSAFFALNEQIMARRLPLELMKAFAKKSMVRRAMRSYS